MVSRTPKTEARSAEYLQGWESLKRMIVEENASWSGSERNGVFVNLRDGTFADVSTISAADEIGDGRSIAETDWDDDGKPDFLLRNRTAPRLQLFRDLDASESHFLAVELRGTTCNRDAIGAVVRLDVAGRRLTKTLYAGDGFLAQSSKRMCFGLGDTERVERLVVTWPGGGETVLADLAGDTRYRITQGVDEAEVIPARTLSRYASLPPAPLARDQSGLPRLDLREKFPLAPVVLPGFEDPARTAGALAGTPALVNLWSTSCAACLVEFKELRDRRAELDRAGLRIVALATDAATERERAEELLTTFGLREHAGYVDERLLAILQLVFAQVVGSQEETPLPTSLLLDTKAQLVGIYFGPVSVDDLLADLASLARMDPDDASDVKLAPGRWLSVRKRPMRSFHQGLRALGENELRAWYANRSKGE